MAPKAKKKTTDRHPEKKWGPFHGGLGIAVWLNEANTVDGPKYYRSITIAPRRYKDQKTGEWKDAHSLRSADIPALILGLQAALEFVHSTPYPGEAFDLDESFDPEHLENEREP